MTAFVRAAGSVGLSSGNRCCEQASSGELIRCSSLEPNGRKSWKVRSRGVKSPGGQSGKSQLKKLPTSTRTPERNAGPPDPY
uniref:Uncharacterized protein n=1 Tax=Anopheles merus TaxID=30066 RepID=A0A182UUK0_ANOME